MSRWLIHIVQSFSFLIYNLFSGSLGGSLCHLEFLGFINHYFSGLLHLINKGLIKVCKICQMMGLHSSNMIMEIAHYGILACDLGFILLCCATQTNLSVWPLYNLPPAHMFSSENGSLNYMDTSWVCVSLSIVNKSMALFTMPFKALN